MRTDYESAFSPDQTEFAAVLVLGTTSIEGRAHTSPSRGRATINASELGDALERDDRQVLSAAVELDAEFQFDARSTSDEHLRCRARRSTRPAFPRLEARHAVRWLPKKT